MAAAASPSSSSSSLPPRPNLDHLRRQAKSLLAALAKGDADAVRTFKDHLPEARGMTAPQIRAAGEGGRFRLADAQSAIARATGFASWPRLARHVEQLRALEGSWVFESLEIDTRTIPAAAMASSRLLIDGDRFRMESPEATYEGVFTIDVETDPHHIDIEFVEGPEAGNTNRGIFRLTDPDRLEICLDMNGKARPAAFRTSAGSGQAYEVLRRQSAARPDNVAGGARATARDANAAAPAAGSGAVGAVDAAAFAPVPSVTLARLQGEWSAESIIRDGQALPDMMLKGARRTLRDNEVTVVVAGMTMVHALVRINESATPLEIDYLNLDGAAKGAIQLGLMEWRDGLACFCTAAPGAPRPTDLDAPPGSGRTFSAWRLEK